MVTAVVLIVAVAQGFPTLTVKEIVLIDAPTFPTKFKLYAPTLR